MRDSVFVSGKHVQSAKIIKIDNVAAEESSELLHKVSVGIHEVSIHCAEAEGAFNSNELEGEERVLIFDAKIQRTYLVRCRPFTHWWIEDIENKAIVAGEKYRE